MDAGTDLTICAAACAACFDILGVYGRLEL